MKGVRWRRSSARPGAATDATGSRACAGHCRSSPSASPTDASTGRRSDTRRPASSSERFDAWHPRAAARLLRRGLLSALPVVALLVGLAAPAAAQTSATVSVSAPTDANEGNSGTRFKYFTVKLSRAISQNVTAKICYSGTATRGASADYQLAANNAVYTSNCWSAIINGGQTSSTAVGIRIRGDTAFESDETVVATLSLTNPPPGVTLGTSTATYTILNDDEDTRPAVTLTRDSATVTEGSRAYFTGSVTPAPSTDLTVNVTVTQSGDFYRATILGKRSFVYYIERSVGHYAPPRPTTPSTSLTAASR